MDRFRVAVTERTNHPPVSPPTHGRRFSRHASCCPTWPCCQPGTTQRSASAASTSAGVKSSASPSPARATAATRPRYCLVPVSVTACDVMYAMVTVRA